MTRNELKEALLEICLPATLAEVLLVNVFIWCLIFIGVGLGG